MPKRRASGEKASKTPRPRKRQAVTKTNSSKIKALIRHNATNSPLLSLPSEVREEILLNLVGNNLIHVKHLSPGAIIHAEGATYGDNYEDDSDGRFNLTNGKAGRFRHAICVATISEQEVYDERVLANTTEDESASFVDLSCRKRHEGCMMTGSGPFKIPPEEHNSLTMDLQVLGACRQLYEECNHLLWTTNTFSFEDATSLDKFFGSLNLAQKRNLSNIHISAHNQGLFRAHRMTNEWLKGFKLSSINVLSGVQNLHLCLQSEFGRYLQYYSYDRSYESLKGNLDHYLKPFLRLRAINAKNISVLLNDDLDEYPNIDMASKWNRSTSNEYAENLRAQLAVPNGVELVKADAEKANEQREITIMIKAKRDATVEEFNMKGARRSVQRYTKRAQEWDRRAERYTAKAAIFLGSSKETSSREKLLNEAESNRVSAETCRTRLLNLQGYLSHLEKKSIEAVAKYKRAEARVQARRVKNGLGPFVDYSILSDEEEFRFHLQEEMDTEGGHHSDSPPLPSDGVGGGEDDQDDCSSRDEDEGEGEGKTISQSKGEWDGFDDFAAPGINEEATDADDELDDDYAP